MAAHSPDVAIFMIGANDASIVTARGEAWAPRYRATVANLLDGLKGKSDRTVYWVGPPTMKANNLNRGTKALSSLMASEARLHENVVFIDAFAMFGDDAGNYTNRIDMPSLNRTNVLVRIGDGVHFTNGGADWIAYNVARALDTQWQITEQSGGTPIRVSVIGGGGSVPGYKPRRNRTSTTTSTSRGAATTTTVDHGSTSTATLTATTVNSSTTTTGLPSTTTPTTTPTT